MKKETDHHARIVFRNISKLKPKEIQQVANWLRHLADDVLKAEDIEGEKHSKVFTARLMK